MVRCAVVGDPVAHSLSPVLHRAAYESLGLDWTYEAVQVPAGGVAGVADNAQRFALRDAFSLADADRVQVRV